MSQPLQKAQSTFKASLGAAAFLRKLESNTDARVTIKRQNTGDREAKAPGKSVSGNTQH